MTPAAMPARAALEAYEEPSFPTRRVPSAPARPRRRLNLFDLEIMNGRAEEALALLFDGTRRSVAFVNAHCVNVAATDPAYARALAKADLLLPDGSGLQLAAKMSGTAFEENLNGTDLFAPLMRRAAASGWPVYFLGGEPGVAEAAARRAAEIAPGLAVAGARDGFFGPEQDDEVIDRINASGARLLLVARGVPLQDVWIARHRARLSPEIAMGVGAQFDFAAGRVSRAPAALRRAGCEWVWRLMQEPGRLAKRYLWGNPRYMLRAAADAGDRALRAGAVEKAARRAADVMLAGLALTVLSPVLLAISAAISLEDRGPVLFRQTRIGRDGVPFTMFKFRSMRTDAERARADLEAASDRRGICFKARNDPRVTRVGRLIRRGSMDELPQLLNVLRGDMSMVGPRPALPSEVAEYPARAFQRLSVKPGITGLWQVSGRADVGFDKMVDMDAAYARSRSWVVETLLLLLTVRAVIGGRGAY